MPSGILSGVKRNTWQNYESRLIAVGNGAVTDPALGTAPLTRGRYLYVPPGLMVLQVQINRGIITDTGAVGDAYAVRLPVPARRAWTIGPQVLGQFMPYKTVTATPRNRFGVVALADAWTSLGGAEDHYVQFYVPEYSVSGTGTWTGGTTNTSFAHGLVATPNPQDVRVVPTSGGGSVNGSWPYIITTDATNVTLTTVGNVNNTPGGTDMTYEWTVSCEANSGLVGSALLGPKRPWPATFESNFFMIQYEPQGVA